MSHRTKLSLAVLTALVVLAAGCGGSDSGSTSTTTGTDTSAAATNTRLTSEQWTQYTTVRTAFVKANTTAQARFNACANLAQSQAQSTATQQKFQQCVGNAYGDLATATQQVGDTLVGFDGTVSGACADALSGFLGYVQPYQRTAAQIQQSVDDADLTAYQSAGQDLETAATAAKGEVQSFEKACRPAS